MTTTSSMQTFLDNIIEPVAGYILEAIPQVGNLILDTPILGMTFGIFLLGGAVSMLSKIMRKT